MAPEIDWEGLVVAFENRSHKITHFFDRQTGDVVQILDRETDRHAAYAADPRYAALPRDEGERSRGDLVDFAAHCEDADCRRDLETALGSSGADAFRAALLKHPKQEAHFFQFKERRARERAREWLKSQGLAK